MYKRQTLSCAYPTFRAPGHSITTLEGLEEDASLLADCLASEGADVYKRQVQGEGFSNVTGRTDLARDAEINTPPRLRMATLYAVGQNLPHGARVANTCNGSEDYVGYSTKFGDAAGDFSPLANLVVEEVRQIGRLDVYKRQVI